MAKDGKVSPKCRYDKTQVFCVAAISARFPRKNHEETKAVFFKPTMHFACKERTPSARAELLLVPPERQALLHLPVCRDFLHLIVTLPCAIPKPSMLSSCSVAKVSDSNKNGDVEQPSSCKDLLPKTQQSKTCADAGKPESQVLHTLYTQYIPKCFGITVKFGTDVSARSLDTHVIEDGLRFNVLTWTRKKTAFVSTAYMLNCQFIARKFLVTPMNQPNLA